MSHGSYELVTACTQAVTSFSKLVKSRKKAVHKPAASLRQAFYKLTTILLQVVLYKLTFVCTNTLYQNHQVMWFNFQSNCNHQLSLKKFEIF